MSDFNPACWLAINGVSTDHRPVAPCHGQLRKCHLIPKQVILRELPPEYSAAAVWDRRVWVMGCGGVMGVGGHHGAFDTARTLAVPRDSLPGGLEAFAHEWNLEWWLDREYGRLAA
jgi:hypothetical protein